MSNRILTALLAGIGAGMGIFLLLTAAARPASAAAADWRYLPIWGGDVRTVAIHPEDPELVFAGTSAGQLYVSKNGGRTWANAGSHLPFDGWVVGALRFDPNPSDPGKPARMWAALWGIWGGGHVAMSDDLGKTWISRAGNLPNEQVYTLALVPGRPGHMYAGTLGGVYGTEDGGLSWKQLTGALAEVQKVTSLWVDADQPDTVIAGTWRRAYRSDDGGKSWNGVFEGMVLDSEVFSLTPVPGKPGEIWASTCGWVYQTKDRGGKWERFKEGFQERRTTSFAALPGGRLLAGTVAGLHISDDAGKTWRRVGDPGIAVHSITWHPARPERVILGTEGAGAWISEDGGASIRPSAAGMINTRISTFGVVGNEILVGVSHAGPFSGLYSSKDGGKSFGNFQFLPTVLDLAVHQGRLFGATQEGLFERRGEGWHWVRDIGTGRVEQFISHGSRLLARTPDGLYELKGKIFTRKPFKHGIPRSAAFHGDALWVTDAQGVYRLTGDANQTVPAPFPGGRLFRLEDLLLLWGPGGTFARTGGADGDWTELVKESSRVLPTGDPNRSALMVSGNTVRLFNRRTRKLEAVDVPVPARDVSAARVINGELWIGTSGYGVLVRPLPPEEEGDPEVKAAGR